MLATLLNEWNWDAFSKATVLGLYRVVSFSRGEFPGELHRWELVVPVMNGFGALGTLYQRAIALPACSNRRSSISISIPL